MLVIKIEMHPYGKEEDKKVLEEIKIVNTMTHIERPKFGNYSIVKDGKEVARVNNYERAKGFLPLVKKAIAEIIARTF
jgi:hypothetical protein